MRSSTKQRYQTAAYILTGLCFCSTILLLLTALFGPKEGMEAMVIIIPWYLATVLHITAGLAAIICVFLTKAYLKNSWILVYYLLFFGINGYTLAIINGVDKAVYRKVDRVTRSEDAELYEILRSMKIKANAGHYFLSPAASKRAYDLMNTDAIDVNYISPGYHRSMIVMAASTDDAQLVERMLEKGAPVDGPPKTGHTPLKAALNTGQAQVVQILLKHGADPNDSRYAHPPLSIATKAGYTDIVQLLLDAGADPDKTTSSSSPALVLAAHEGQSAIIQALLQHGADPNITAFGGATALMAAIRADCIQCVSDLLKAGATGQGKNNRGETALAMALKSENAAMLTTLQENTDEHFGSAHDLFYAVQKGDLVLLEKMLAFGVNPNARDEHGSTLLMHVARKNQYQKQLFELSEQVTQLLLKYGADTELTTKHDETALLLAISTGNTNVANTLIKAHANIDTMTEDGRTPLLAAIQKNSNDIALALLSEGADPNRYKNTGRFSKAPLLFAAQHNNPELIRALFKTGAKLQTGSKDLCDILKYAAQHHEILQVIMESGVDLNVQCSPYYHPLDIVVRHGTPKSIHYLLENGVSPILHDWKGIQPFMYFVKNNQAELVLACLQQSPELRENKKLLQEGMYWAVRSAHPQVVRAMLNYNHAFHRIEEIQALLKWAKTPPATEADKQEIIQIFSEYFSKPKIH
ncbi:ankyrin repeat domain-containing protein [Desulfogranum japonicum]|uniref:ankyrin repeat domain-containing protein n=1 Tax=Desulfogranum japonicum TaxID=231447 RepID=UPI00041D3D38|nr:ankyrin repeat domain-containing protein [Desulfogranum japonicum]